MASQNVKNLEKWVIAPVSRYVVVAINHSLPRSPHLIVKRQIGVGRGAGGGATSLPGIVKFHQKKIYFLVSRGKN